MPVLWPTGHLTSQIHGMQRYTNYIDMDSKTHRQLPTNKRERREGHMDHSS
jgi:hypothetical protein